MCPPLAAPMPIPTDDELTQANLTPGAPPSGSDLGVATRGLAPGSILAGRYRLVALLGRGGMGEVYRADDLTLDQPVALKFLPESVTAGDERLNQFHNELRIARRVSHKNVCRLYDLGEAGGRRFLTMEYVDGEDLSSLLRRIGRLPQDKAIEIARQLCAGVAAAHERGVLHRDLKPANVMLDAEGNVRITDFGIATTTADQHDLSGTPQYMAPEQFAGRPASVASEVHALGLILFEIFTGRRAIDSPTLTHLRDFHKSGTITTPSTLVRDLDPAVDRVIVRCLNKDPARRPASALAVAAALPGADPVAAALAAGETPSPEILATAGEVEAVGVVRGITLVFVCVAGLLAFAIYSARSSIPGRTPLDLSPEVLADRAAQVATSLGHPDAAADRAYGFLRPGDYTGWLFRTRQTPQRYAPVSAGIPSAVLFWHRSSPRPLQPMLLSQVTTGDPPSTETDMRTVVLDPRGRLREFRSVPPQRDAGKDSTAPPWDALFAAAGLEMRAFTEVQPEWTPRDYADVRGAWEGPLGDPDATHVRVEAGAYRGKIVSFSIVGPWTQATLMQGRQQSQADRVIIATVTVAMLGVFVVAALIARRNLRANRADRRGAARLAAFTACVGFLVWLLRAHHSSAVQAEFQNLFRALSDTALTTALIWVIYIALEPYVRRLWPDSLLGWSRLMAGHLRDPRVGRDVLTGVAVGVAVSLIDVARTTMLPWLGYAAPSPPYGGAVDILNGPGRMIASWALASGSTVQAALTLVLMIVLIRLTLRRAWLTIPVTALLLGFPAAAQTGTTNTTLILLFPLATGILFTLLVFRSGLLAFATAWFVWSVLSNVPMVQDWSHWSAAAGNWTLAALTALALFGFYAARAGQPLLGTILKE
jgi:serine/threonine-protein kinase